MTFWGCVSEHPWFATVWAAMAYVLLYDLGCHWHNVRRNEVVARIKEAEARKP